MGKLQIEFDETSQLQRLRFGLMATEAVFSVLASCQGFYDYNYGCKHVRRDVLIILDFKDCRHFFCCLAFFLCFSEIVLGSADNSDHHEK